MTRRRALGLAGAWAASLAAVFLLTRTDPPAPPSARSAPGDRTVVVERAGADRVIATGGLTAAEIRAAVRAELAAATGAPPTERDPVVEETPRDETGFERADSALAIAMADGRWSEGDRDAFRASLDGLDQDQVESLLQTVIPAINTGELAVETHGSPI